MSEGKPKKSTDLLNTAEFRDKHDEAMLRSHRAGNRRLRLIPEVRDHGDKLAEGSETVLDKTEDNASSPVPPPRDASKAIRIFEMTLPIMTKVDIEKVRSMLPPKEDKVSSNPSDPPYTVFFIGLIIGALFSLFAYRAYSNGYPKKETESKEVP